MNPIQVPAEWDDNGHLVVRRVLRIHPHTPTHRPRLERRGLGPRWWRFNGTGRLYTTVAELRRFLRPAITSSREAGNRG